MLQKNPIYRVAPGVHSLTAKNQNTAAVVIAAGIARPISRHRVFSGAACGAHFDAKP
jgi:hypothetical protein